MEKSGSTITSTKQFVWLSGEPQPSEERVSNNVTNRYYMQGMVIVSGRNAGSYYYTQDHLGSIRELTDNGGIVQARYDYDPYGARTKLTGTTEADFGYEGNYLHSPSGVYATLYRFYDASYGRWLSRDPVAENGGINLYCYVANGPILHVDELGLWPKWYDCMQIARRWTNDFRRNAPDCEKIAMSCGSFDWERYTRCLKNHDLMFSMYLTEMQLEMMTAECELISIGSQPGTKRE